MVCTRPFHHDKKKLLYELYIHNFIIPIENQWNPLLYIGDIHLRALMSWMHNEANYDRQLNNYRDEEIIEPMPLRAKSKKLEEILRYYFKLTYGDVHKEIRKKIFEARTKVYAEYDNMPYFFF